MRIECPHCGRQGKLPDGVQSPKLVRCPGCKQVFGPAPARVSASYDLTLDVEPPPAHYPAKSPSRSEVPALSTTRLCDFCGETIQAVAKKCKHCGELLDPVLRAAEEARRAAENTARNQPTIVNNVTAVAVAEGRRKRWSPVVAMLLSFLIPGLGQLYKGQLLNGLVWFLFVIGGYCALIVPGLLLHLLCVIGAAMGDPYS